MDDSSLTDTDKFNIMRVSTQGLLPHLFRHTVSVVDTYGSDNDPTKWGVFSGTLISIDDLILVATASHCISNRTDLSRFWIQGDAPSYRADGFPRVVATHFTPGDDPDVGIIEVDRESLAQFSGKTGLELDRIRPSGIGRTNRLAILTGSPGERVKEVRDETSKGICMRVDGYASRPWEESEWPSVNLKNPLDPKKDIVMDYPEGTTHTRSLETGEPIPLPNPKGMSGGGLWDQGFGERIWSPESAFLIGIQSSWNPSKRYIRAVQIERWLKLVHQNYERMRETLEGNFPAVFSPNT